MTTPAKKKRHAKVCPCGCQAPIKNWMLCCGEGWKRIPKNLRQELKLQNNRCRGSLLHRAAARKCLEALKNPVAGDETTAGVRSFTHVGYSASPGLRMGRGGA